MIKPKLNERQNDIPSSDGSLVSLVSLALSDVEIGYCGACLFVISEAI